MTTKETAPTWFKAAAFAALAWSLVGVASYFMDVTATPEAMAKLPANQQELYARRPAWIVGVYAISVFSALAGSIVLLMRRKWSTPLYGLSFVSVVVQFAVVLFVLGAVSLLGWTAAIFPAVIVLLGAAMLQLSRTGAAKGWLY